MKNFKIGFRLSLGFAIVLMLLGIIVFYSMNRMSAMDESSARIIKTNYAKVALVNHVRADIAEIYDSLFVMMSIPDKETRLKEQGNIENLRKDYLSKVDQMQKLESNTEGNDYIKKLTDEISNSS